MTDNQDNTWNEHGNSGMKYPEESDIIGGATDCVDNQELTSKELDAHKGDDLSDNTYDINVYKSDGKLCCIYLDGYRIAGEKPPFLRDCLYGEYKVSLKNIIRAIPELREQTRQLTTTQQTLEAMELLWKDEIEVTRREQDRHKITQQALDSAVEALKAIEREIPIETPDKLGLPLVKICRITLEALASIKDNNEMDICEQLAKEDL